MPYAFTMAGCLVDSHVGAENATREVLRRALSQGWLFDNPRRRGYVEALLDKEEWSHDDGDHDWAADWCDEALLWLTEYRCPAGMFVGWVEGDVVVAPTCGCECHGEPLWPTPQCDAYDCVCAS